MASNLFEVPAYMMSLLKPQPVVARVVEFDEYVVFWNGIVMPYAAALYVATRSSNVFPTMTVKDRIDDSFRRLRHTGVLRRKDVDAARTRGAISTPDVTKGYEFVMRAHVNTMLQTHTVADLFAMLDIDKAHDIRVFGDC